MFKLHFIYVLLVILALCISNSKEHCETTTKPNTRYDCFVYSNSTNRCCFEKKGSNCISVAQSELATTKYDCGANEAIFENYEFTSYKPTQPEIELLFQGCGQTKPSKKSHCTDYSQLSNSCCYFKWGDKKGCYSIGKKYSGEHKKVEFTYKDMEYTYECKDNTDSNQQVQQNQGMFTTHLNSILKDILPPEDDQQGDNLGEEESIDFGEVNDDIFGISEGMTDDSCSGNAFGFNRNEFGYKPQTVKVYNNVYKTDNENGQGNANDYERKEKKASKTLQINSNNVYLQQQQSAMMISNGNSNNNNECNINNNNFTFVNDNDNPLRNYFIKKTYNYPMYNQHHYQNLIPFPQQYPQSSPSLNNINTSHPLICHSQAQTQTLLQTSSQYKSSRRFNTSHYNPPHRKPTHLGSEMTIYLSELEHELRNSSHITISIFSSIRPRLLLIIKTQIGSRILQTYLPNSPNQVISLIYQDIYDKINVLLLDPYANYFLIKLFAALSTNERISFLQIIVKNIITFSSNKIATYPIQCIIGTISSPQEKMIIVSHLIKHIQKIAFDIYGTHVIEKAIICLEKEYTHDIVLYIINNFTLIANHVNSLCLAKKVLMLDNAHEFMPQLKTILVNNCYALIENPYGNYALQIVLDTWNESEIEDILATIQNNCIELSMMKYSSNVIEKCLQKSTVFLQAFVIQVCTTKSIGGLIRNSYGNYVVQTALKVAKGELKVILINEIENNLNMLGEKKLINKWKSILALNIIECVNQSDNNINSLERMQVRTKESGV